MILIVCPNLAVDYTLHVPQLEVGTVHRSRWADRRAGGKGVNAARALKTLGQDPLVCGFVGGNAGVLLRQSLRDERIGLEPVSVEAENRTCTIILSDGGRSTVVNEPGPHIDQSDCLSKKATSLVRESQAVLLMGSLPPGVPADFYARLIAECRTAATPCLVDTSGSALAPALEARPSYAKPNRDEAESLFGRSLNSDARLLEAARELRIRGAEAGLITLGSEGVILVGDQLLCRLRPPRVAPVNATGAGDALAAGLVTGHLRGLPLLETAALAVAVGAASVHHGYGRFDAEQVRPESVEILDPL